MLKGLLQKKGFHLNGHTLFVQSQNLEQLDAQSVIVIIIIIIMTLFQCQCMQLNSQLIGDPFLRTGKQIYYMTFKLILSYLKPKTIKTNVHESKFTQVTAVTIIIYMAPKVHTTYMFLECFEACQVSELTTDL